MASHAFSAASLFNLRGQVALVTGGGTGIGLMAATALATNGARVYITGRRMEVLEKAAKETDVGEGSLVPIQMDVCDKESIEKVVKEVESKEKYLSLLINNAGVAKGVQRGLTEAKKDGIEAYSKKMLEYDPSVFEFVYKTNVTSVWFVTAAFLPLLSKARTAQSPESGASIINLTSISGFTKTTQRGQEIYNSSKAALVSLTNQMASEMISPEINLRVNSIAPGLFPTEMTDGIPSAEDREFFLNRGIPMGRPGLPAEMAQTVLFLACNPYMHGQHVVVDGGWGLLNR